MRFIIVGAGDVGLSLCERLAGDDHDVVLIEKSEKKAESIPAGLDVEVMIGDACSPGLLLRAGINTTDYVVAVADVDEVNISVCLVARLINKNAKRVARIRNLNFTHPDITPEHLHDYFDLIINPDQAAADFLLRSFKVPGAKEVFEFCEGKVRVLGIGISRNSPVINRKLHTLKEFQDRFPVLIISILRGSKLIIPSGNDRVRAGDVIYCVTVPEKTSLIFELAGKTLAKAKSAMIWGTNMLGCTLAHELEEQGVSVKLIVKDREEGTELTDRLPNTLILTGEGTDQNLLIEENVGDIDSFIAVTEREEDNILAGLLAKRLGARTCMTLINKGTYLPLVSAIGVDVVVSPRLAAASEIFHWVHADSVISEFTLGHHGASFIEFEASDDMELVGKPVKELKFPHGVILSAIERNDEIVIPGGDTEITAGDRVVVFATKSSIGKLEKMVHLNLELV